MLEHTSLAALLTCTFALAQGTVFVPDNIANAGTCNAIPLSASFGSGAMTYVARIPASYMDPTQRLILDVMFAPCGSTAFSAPSLQMGLGHVPNPVPNPFTFPSFDPAGNMIAPGSFLDYQPLWNSVVQGPFNYAMTQDTWSPMGFAPGGTGFVWNGIDDVGFFITYSGATGGNSGHRTATEPFRLYASGAYQATVSSGSGAAGLKMALTTTTNSRCSGCGALSLGMSGVPRLGGQISATLSNLGGGVPFIGLGFAPFCIAPLCNNQCMIGHSWPVASFGPSLIVNVPNNPLLLGLQVGFQGMGLLSPGGCTAPLLALTDTFVITVVQ